MPIKFISFLAFAFVGVVDALILNNEIESIFVDILQGIDLSFILKALERVNVDISTCKNGVNVIFVDVPKLVVDKGVGNFEREVTLLSLATIFLKTVVVLKVECTIVDTRSVAEAIEIEETVDFFEKKYHIYFYHIIVKKGINYDIKIRELKTRAAIKCTP